MGTPDRVIAQTGTGPTVTSAIQDEITALYNASVLPLTITGASTANALVATLVPVLTAGVIAGMGFSFKPTITNTAAATISINGGSTIPLATDDGAAVGAGQIVANRLYLGISDGTSLRVLGTAGTLKINDYQAFTANGTWTKPTGCPPNALVTIKTWGAGAGGGAVLGGGASSGGGGGGYVEYRCRASDLASSVSVTIGAGGTPGNAGGTTSFGSLVLAFGGGAGTSVFSGSNNQATGGGGGGFYRAGLGGVANSTGGGLAGGLGGDLTSGAGSSTLMTGGTTGSIAAQAGAGYFGGGGGGAFANGTGGNQSSNGGGSLYGGGGGAGWFATLGGVSVFGGNGGTPGASGQAPGGGGGANGGSGARGEVRVHVNG